jgi:uncharacterized protein (TIGR02611 family)
MLRSSARLARRVVITVVGIAILAVGGVLLVAPGPGFLVIALGLFTLGLEYDWARRRLEYVRGKVADLAEAAVAKPWSTVGSVVAALLLVAAGVFVGVDDRLPASGWWTGGSLIAAGLIALATILISLLQARRTGRQARRTAADNGSSVRPPAQRQSPPAANEASTRR